jgi:four helix bundle protein
MGNFQKLRVWQLAKELAVNIYKLTQNEPFQKDFGLRNQIQRSAISIPSNIAEGDELGSDKQSVHYFYIAKGSAAELMTQLIIGKDIGYINETVAEKIINECNVISVMLRKLINSRS